MKPLARIQYPDSHQQILVEVTEDQMEVFKQYCQQLELFPEEVWQHFWNSMHSFMADKLNGSPKQQQHVAMVVEAIQALSQGFIKTHITCEKCGMHGWTSGPVRPNDTVLCVVCAMAEGRLR